MMIGRDRTAGGSGNRPRAAVVGSGVAGLTAAYLLSMWDLYLAYSEAGFRAGYLDLHQLVLERGAP
jgi:predicted NAD/FAD-binding protein